MPFSLNVNTREIKTKDLYNYKKITYMESKEVQGEPKELKTAFDAPKFLRVIETLKAAQDAIENLSSCYDEGDKKREALNEVSHTIETDIYSLLSGVIGSDFVECAQNCLKG